MLSQADPSRNVRGSEARQRNPARTQPPMGQVWKDLRRNRTSFDRLRQRLADLSIELTPVRIYDVLCLTQEKRVIRGSTHAKHGVGSESN